MRWRNNQVSYRSDRKWCHNDDGKFLLYNSLYFWEKESAVAIIFRVVILCSEIEMTCTSYHYCVISSLHKNNVINYFNHKYFNNCPSYWCVTCGIRYRIKFWNSFWFIMNFQKVECLIINWNISYSIKWNNLKYYT